MRLFIAAIIGVFGGYLLGIALSSWFMVDYLPYYLAAAGAVIALVIMPVIGGLKKR